MKNQKTLRMEEYTRLNSLLKGIEDFIEQHDSISYIEFDHYAVHDMILFSIEPDFDFKKLQERISNVKKALPAVKRIFKKPIIFLKDSEDVLPVENARVINQNTLFHLANHTQYISNITKKGIKPRKLLTRIYEDKYGIYENLIFCNFIDQTMSYIRKNRKTLNNIYYASNIMKFNILEKGNHINYFLAMGKLHTGYIRDFSVYHSISKELIDEMNHIYNTIKSRLYKPVYKNNKKRNKRLRLKKTNIFINQKDYKVVYRTYKKYNGKVKNQIDEKTFDFEKLNRAYLMYVRVLTIFAVGNFNYSTGKNAKMNLGNLNTTFTFKDWILTISNKENEELVLEFKKDKIYKILITTSEIEEITYPDIDEVVTVTHFEEDYVTSKEVLIRTDEIDSFRRIHQILLKGMILSDSKRDVCPFCGGELKVKNNKYHQCFNCLLQIKKHFCPNTDKEYIYTESNTLSRNTFYGSELDINDSWLLRKQIESAMYYRNITKINRDSEIVCPHCDKVH